MGKSTTEQAQNSKDKKALNKISLKVLFDFLHEDDGGDSREIKLLKAHYADALSDSKTAAFSRGDLLDRGLGKPKQQLDLTSDDESINQGFNPNNLSPNELIELAKLADKATDK